MRGPARALMAGFGTTTTSLELEHARIVWNSTLDLNQTRPGWVSPEISVAAFDVENFTREETVTSSAMKEKNWPALLILIIIALTIGGNILVILAVSLEKKLQNATNFFLRSLAVADMLVGILVMPISLINILYGSIMPIPVIGLHNEDKVFVNGSCVLNEERFMLIGSFVAFFIPLVIMVVTYCSLYRQATVFLCEARSSSQQPLHQPNLTSSLQPPPTFSIPQINTLAPPEEGGCILRSISVADSISILPSSEGASQLSSEGASSGRRGMMQAIKNEKRASKVLGIVFFLFLIMWCPFFITNVTSVLCRDSCDVSLLHDLLNVFVWVGYISSGVNPLVYTLFNKTYRRAFSNYIRCRYRSGANAAGGKTLPVPPPCPSHSVTPLLAGAKSGVDRNSNCRNGSRGNNLRLAVDPEDTTDDGTQYGCVSLSVSEYQNAGAISETETEPELSVISCSPAPRELSATSSASKELTSAV
ncbi:hypothetical protein WMY93_015741 [Mugilogobius chulae]|uniref:G-protein coupled receptors family 1 profile domain-containing protein n=1 Tax=Mugilogobius chulae TaxID=88201 RepID=A0AAW0NR06_9GOBI